MSLEDDIFTCFNDRKEITPESIQALVALIYRREKLWLEEVGRLKVDLHFAVLAQDELREEHSDDRTDLNDRIEELEKQLYKCLGEKEEAPSND